MTTTLADERLDEARAGREAREGELAVIEAQIAELEQRISDIAAEADGMRGAAINAMAEGSPAAINGISMKRLEREVADAALEQLRRRRDQAALSAERAKGEEAAARSIVGLMEAAGIIEAVAPIVANLIDKLKPLDVGNRAAVIEALRGPEPNLAAAELHRRAASIYDSVAAMLDPAPPPRPAPPSDTLVKSSRRFRYSYRSADERTVPAGWMGFVPAEVADLLVASQAAKRIDPLVKVIVRGKGMEVVSGIRTQINGQVVNLALVSKSAADALVANECGILLNEPPTPADYFAAFGAAYDNNEPILDLGTVDAPQAASVAQILPTPEIERVAGSTESIGRTKPNRARRAG